MAQTLLNLYRNLTIASDRLMGLMMLSLHGLLVWGSVEWLKIGLFLLHYTLFLLWQPVLQNTSSLSKQTIIFILLGGAIGLVMMQYFMSWWVVAFWIASLFSLIGGRIFSGETQRDRLPNLLAASYLLAILLLWVVPKLLGATDDLAAAEYLLIYLLPVLPLAVLFLSAQNDQAASSANIDFFYTLLLFLTTNIIIFIFGLYENQI